MPDGLPHDDLLNLLTDLGNLYVALPVALVIGIWASCVIGWRAAVKLAFLMAALIALVGGLKYAAWTDWGREPGVFTKRYLGAPSGHAALAGFVYGVVALFALRARNRQFAVAGCLTFGALALAIAFSRVALGAHPVIEVIAGLVSAVPFLALAFPTTLRRTPGNEIGLISATLAMALVAEISGLRFHAEQNLFLYLQNWL